ncbi:MAG: L,D-transpeptidase family protein, partial [Clostridia bacterium]|nr:L,D-transpeptidase family protein [Clostridia bacterium]
AGLKWYKIDFKGKTGYVCSTYATYKASGGTTTTKKPTTTTAKPNSSSGGTVVITNSYTNVRSGAGSSNSLLGKAYKDEKYTYLGTATSPAGLKWYKINFKGKTGYVCSTYASYKASGGGSNNKYVVNPNYASKYYIVVYVGSQSTVVYGKDANGNYNTVVKSFTCSTGAKATPTRLGQYTIWRKFNWRLLSGNVYGQYSSSISSSYLFHSVPYTSQSPSSLKMDEYKKLGTKASEGCIRLCVRDCKWIYDNCPVGTQVNIVNDSGPKGAGVPSLKTGSKYAGWDPSDPNPKSPYNK